MITPEIKSLIQQCEANVLSFDNDQMSAALYAIETAHREVVSVLECLDDLAEVWGDEGVFRRCRDRLRTLAEPQE